MLPTDQARCAGFAPRTQHDKCPRRGECARFRSRAVCPKTGQLYPFEWSACEGGDAFLHVATVAQDTTPGHPADAPPDRVLSASPLRTTPGAE